MNFDFHAQTHALQLLPNVLNEIQNAQLIRHAEEQENAFWFKHALVQDTAYASLMRHDRKRLHRLVAETLERMNPERPDDLAPRLAEHFEEAGETARALFYLERAGQAAAARYANREAVDFYTRALDAANELQTDTRDSLHRARGVVYERIGKFDEARADLEHALNIARQEGDALAEWQSLIDLGFAWTARDYTRAGEYFENALELARVSNDTARIAHTLNRVGNWYVNNDEPQRAAAYHQEALQMFEALNDTRGVAETQDLLGMTKILGANYLGAVQHVEAAIALFEQLNDRWATVNTRMLSYLQHTFLQASVLVVQPVTRDLEKGTVEILDEMRQLGWRSGEAFSMMVLGEGFAGQGAYGRALELERAAMTLAREINHRQWLAGASIVCGEIFAQLLNFELALPYLENGLALARELGSMHWKGIGSGFLASALVVQNELEHAQETMDLHLPLDAPAVTVGQRQVWAARVELALVRHDADAALAALEKLERGAVNLEPGVTIPRLALLRARALLLKNDTRTAEQLILAARDAAQATKQPPWEWRSRAVLAQLYRAQGRDADSTRQVNAATQVVQELAATVQEEAVRETFLTRAMQRIQGA